LLQPGLPVRIDKNSKNTLKGGLKHEFDLVKIGIGGQAINTSNIFWLKALHIARDYGGSLQALCGTLLQGRGMNGNYIL